jgi:hypothetical protein
MKEFYNTQGTDEGKKERAKKKIEIDRNKERGDTFSELMNLMGCGSESLRGRAAPAGPARLSRNGTYLNKLLTPYMYMYTVSSPTHPVKNSEYNCWPSKNCRHCRPSQPAKISKLKTRVAGRPKIRNFNISQHCKQKIEKPATLL